MQHWFDNVILDNWIKSIFHVKIKLDAIVAPSAEEWKQRTWNNFIFLFTDLWIVILLISYWYFNILINSGTSVQSP